jgi:hypothetical protein
MKRLRAKLTFSNVVAVVALFIALGGASYAATRLPKNSVGSKQIKKDAVTGAKIKKGAVTGDKIALSSLGTIPSAARATLADSAIHADTAAKAADASALGGLPPSAYATTRLEAPHIVGQPGEPIFEGGCGNFSPTDITPISFYKDPTGVVHLRGYASECDIPSGPIFTLPAGFRPPIGEFFPAVSGNTTSTLVEVKATGLVQHFGASTATLGGIEFRTDD